ncbi:MAG: 3-oxoacyl-[acyl-carrier-protein] reductase [Eubacterium sp.]|nr:3-oxoacyl-[acyl-carrier-protein] reductase [Eubacterium sp.]
MDGKVAVVTGASRGIGAAIARRLASEQIYVVVNYSGSKEAADQVVEEIKAAGGQAESVKCNVSDVAAVDAMMKDIIKRLGRVDILVNNAGITKDNLILKMTPEDFEAVLDVNLKGTFYTMKAVSKQMLRQRRGCIVNLSSFSGIHGNAGQMNYAASKAGVIGMTKSMAKELASRNIRVNAVAPGFVETDMTAALGEATINGAKELIPLGRFAKAEEIASVVHFLVSEEASYITGQVIETDGGLGI